MKIKRMVDSGELGRKYKNTDDLMDEVATALDRNYCQDAIGTVEFIGEDGKLYQVQVNAEIVCMDEEDS